MVEDLDRRFMRGFAVLKGQNPGVHVDFAIQPHIIVISRLDVADHASNKEQAFMIQLGALADACAFNIATDTASKDSGRPDEWFAQFGFENDGHRMLRQGNPSRASLLTRQKVSALLFNANLPTAKVKSNGPKYPVTVLNSGYHVSQFGDTARVHYECVVRLGSEQRAERVALAAKAMADNGIACTAIYPGSIDISLNQAVPTPQPTSRKTKSKAATPTP